MADEGPQLFSGLTPEAMARVTMHTRAHPWDFLKDWFGEDAVHPKQRQILEALRDYREVHVPSCHDSSKTWTAARAVLWFLFAYPNDSVVLTTAPTWDQVENQLWKEINAAASHWKPPIKMPGKLLRTSYELGPKWYAIGRSTDNPVSMQGFHEANILVVLDEADGIPKDIWNALDSALTSGNPKLLATGNPIDPTSEWARRQERAVGDPDKTIIRIAADDVIPYSDGTKASHKFLLTQRWVDEKLIQWGGPDAPMSQAKIFARYPTQSSDTLIQLSHLMRARYRTVEKGIRTLGVDVARYGGNRTVLTLLEGNQLVWSHAYRMEDTVQTSSRVISAIQEFGPAMTAIDETGVGGGVVDMVRSRLGRNASVIGVNNGAVAQDSVKFMNRGAEMWWTVREAFEGDRIGFAGGTDPDSVEVLDELINDLNRPVVTWQERTSKIRVDKFGRGRSEERMSTEERASDSPDRADSFVLAFCAALPYVRMGQKSISRSRSYMPSGNDSYAIRP